jgi:AcrR family transcriptional regulator
VPAPAGSVATRAVAKPEAVTRASPRDDSRLAVSRAALELFVDEGDTSATVQQIAGAVGISTRTFYRYFAAKEDVVVPVLRRSTGAILAAIDASPPDTDLLDRLVSALLVEVDGGRLNERQRAFLRIVATTPAYRDRWLQMDHTLHAALMRLMKDELAPGSDDFMARLGADLVLGAARTALDHWVVDQAPGSAEVLLRRSLHVVLRGLGLRPDLEL